MQNCLNRKWVCILLLVGLVAICFGHVLPVAASDTEKEETFCFGVEPAYGSDEIDQYINDNLKEIIEHVLISRHAFPTDHTIGSTLFISKPFFIYSSLDEPDLPNEEMVYHYAVISDYNVICTINVKRINGELKYSLTNRYVNELSTLCHDNNNRKVYVYIDDNENTEEIIFTNTESNIIEHYSEDIVLADLSYLCQDIEDCFIDEFSNGGPMITSILIDLPSFITTNCPGNGFLSNTATNKMLNTDYCLALSGYRENEYGLIASLYNYRTARRNMTADILYSINNALPPTPFDVITQSGCTKLINYIMPVSSNVRYKTKNSILSHFNVMHNINNTFPVLVRGKTYLSPTVALVRRYMLFGYQLNSQQQMSWYLFDASGSGAVFSSAFYDDGSSCVWIDSQTNRTWTEEPNASLLY